MDPAPHTSDEPLADIDLYCLKCGYNLRGLSGDPRRCPECGAMNPVGAMRVPAELIREQLQRMETGPAVCVLAALIGLAISIGILIALLRYQSLGALNVCTGTVLLGAGWLWGWGAWRFRRSCLEKPEWTAVLAQYHVLGLGLCILLLIGTPVGYIAIVQPLCTRLGAQGRIVEVGLWLTTAAVCVAAILLGYARFYPGVRARMDQLQREVAVTIARDVLRRRQFEDQ